MTGYEPQSVVPLRSVAWNQQPAVVPHADDSKGTQPYSLQPAALLKSVNWNQLPVTQPQDDDRK